MDRIAISISYVGTILIWIHVIKIASSSMQYCVLVLVSKYRGGSIRGFTEELHMINIDHHPQTAGAERHIGRAWMN